MTIGANRAERRYLQRRLQKANEAYGPELVEVPQEDWPQSVLTPSQQPFRVLRSRRFLVQLFTACGDVVRLSASRTALRTDGRWDDGVTWDELQDLKRQAGYGEAFAVEVYPPDYDVVNVGNLRHLWILPDDRIPPYAWRRPRA